MPIVLSASQVSAVEGCPRAMQFRFGAKLRSTGSDQNLAIGSAFHGGLAAYYNRIMHPTSAWTMRDAVDHEIQKEVSRNADTDAVELENEVSRLLTWYTDPNIPGNGYAMDKEDNIIPITLETVFKLPLTKEGDVEIVGIIDMLAVTNKSRDIRGNCVYDHKTSQRGGASFTRGLQYDPQFLLYAWAARECGFPPEWFCWNVTVKTKTPQLIRHYEPVNWHRIDMYVNRAAEFARYCASRPTKIADILAMPGNPGQCRHCMFNILCDYPAAAIGIANSEFRVEQYQDFTKYRTLPVIP